MEFGPSLYYTVYMYTILSPFLKNKQRHNLLAFQCRFVPNITAVCDRSLK